MINYQNLKQISLQLNIYDQKNYTAEVKEFWDKKWNQAMTKLVGHPIDPELFFKQSYFYTISVGGKIAVLMSATRQSLNEDLFSDPYYSSYPEGLNYLKFRRIESFYKMGMIVAEPRLFPKKTNLVPLLVGFGLDHVLSLPDCQGAVSFPRTDTSVYDSCMHWGSLDLANNLTLYNAPVAFVYCDKSLYLRDPNHESVKTLNMLLGNSFKKLA